MRNPFDSTPWSSSWSDTLSRSWARVPATAGVVVSTALLAGLTYAVWRAVRSTHVARQGARPGGQPEDVTRWEGEGGGVPVGSTGRTASELSTGSTGMGGGLSSSPAGGVSSGRGTSIGSSIGGNSPGSLTH